jgi:hypothetical protein
LLVVGVLMRWRTRQPTLELLALNEDGRFAGEVLIPAAAADSGSHQPGALARVPLILAVRNTGGQAAQPQRLELNVPIRYRLSGPDRRPLAGRATPGNPLVRYELDLPFPVLEPGAPPVAMPYMDTIWVEPVVQTFHCIALSDSVPDFVPAPAVAPASLSQLQIFYSFSGDEMEQRQAGLLSVEIDQALLDQKLPDPPPVFQAQVRHPSVPMPVLGGLDLIGHRSSFCGPPEQPLQLFTTAWETPSGGRMYVVYFGGAPRKYLFDLNGDGVIEQEMWDSDGDGMFESRRTARLPTPAFLLPPERAPAYDASFVADLPDDSLAQLDRFRLTPSSRYRQQFAAADTAAQTSRFRGRSNIVRIRPGEPREERQHVTVWAPGHPLAAMATPPAAASPDRARPMAPAPRDPTRPPAAANARSRQPDSPPLLGREAPGSQQPARPPAARPAEPPPRQAPPAQRTPDEPPPARPAPAPAAPQTPSTPPEPRQPREPEPRPAPTIELLGRPTDSVP